MPTTKMDPKLLSAQSWEMRYLVNKLHIPQSVIEQVKKKVGRSRAKIVAELADPRYAINKETLKKLNDQLANGK